MTPALALSCAALAAVLLSATARWSEALVAVPAALLVVAGGAVSVQDAVTEVRNLLPVVGFLAVVLVLAGLCDDEGLFRLAGRWMARGNHGHPRRLLGRVFLAATATTAVLSLDATAVLLTPVVLATVRSTGAPPRPHLYATAHLSNTASLLLPVSNLTNLLAYSAAGLSFTRFGALMAGPWLVAVAAEYLLFRMVFRHELVDRPVPTTTVGNEPVPVLVLSVLAVTLVGFAVISLVGLSPAWAALAGASVLAVRSLSQGRSTPAGILGWINLPFLAFVLALGVVVKAVMVNGLDSAAARLLPSGTGLAALFAIAAVAAVLSNLVNNLPAVLVLLPLAAATGPGAVLAVLIGVNIGPNLTYIGSLSNLLWRNLLHQQGEPTSARQFSALGLLTVPVSLAGAVMALWAALALVGV
ncbi:MAG: arsenic transporter [Mycobacterium sp.]|nr:arsenic transporter [Mycobacterium sp.]